MKLISFSLWGNDPKYLYGALRNVELAHAFYPEWVCRFYINDTASATSIERAVYRELRAMGAEIIAGPEEVPPVMWRFLAGDDGDMEYFIVRDADSRISAREAAAVAGWIASGKRFHTMRDHPAHARPINGGMWGACGGFLLGTSMLKLMTENMAEFHGPDPDQQFLGRVIWPRVVNIAMQHDSICRGAYPGAVPFPTKREGKRFVGEVYDHNDVPRDGDWQMTREDE